MTAHGPVTAGHLKRVFLWAFEPILFRGAGVKEETVMALRRARIGVLPEWYVAASYAAAALAAVLGMAAGSAAVAFIPKVPWFAGIALALAAGGAFFLIVRLGFLLYPRMRAKTRQRLIEADFQSVVVMCYALARGGVSIVNIFRSISEERDAYGEASREFGLVIQDLDVFGMDSLVALENVAATTPSSKLRDFFHGLVTVLKTGSDPRDFFKRQADLQLNHAERELEKELDQASLLAEVYVSGLLVLPLLLLVVLSVLTTITNAGARFIPLVVFALIPLGTAVYLILIDTLMPAESLKMPKPRDPPRDDFGVDSLPSHQTMLRPSDIPSIDGPGDSVRFGGQLVAAPRPKSLRPRLRRIARRTKAAVARSATHAVAAAAIGATIILAGGFIAITKLGLAGTTRMIGIGGILVATAAFAVIPAALYHETRVREVRRLDDALPEALSRLASFNDRGVNLLRAFGIVGRKGAGGIHRVFRSVSQDVMWNGNFATGLRRLRTRVRSRRVAKLSVLFERASRATGNLKDVLDIAAAEASKTGILRARKRQAMLSYVFVIYVVFAVFLYVIVTIARLFQDGSFTGAGALTGGKGLDTLTAYSTFQNAVMIQGVSAGLVAGRLGEGYLTSGIKHAVVLAGSAWLAFTFGVGLS